LSHLLHAQLKIQASSGEIHKVSGLTIFVYFYLSHNFPTSNTCGSQN
jgi:hypothetical protein